MTACGPGEVPLITTGPVEDLQRIPQNAQAFVQKGEDLILESPANGQRALERYWFKPWQKGKPLACSAEELAWAAAPFTNQIVFGPNLVELPIDRLDALIRNARLTEYPNKRAYAVTVRNSAMRALPSAEPIFFDFRKAGEGYPFDYNQNSAIWAGTPIQVVQLSADGRFVGVESPFSCGWIDARDVAYVDQASIEKFRAGRLAAVRKDWLPLADKQGNYLFDGRIGMLLPVLRVDGDFLRLAAPQADASRRASWVEVRLRVPDAGLTPLPFTEQALARSIDEILGQPYGWGGLGGYRDCSSTMLDLFLPLGLPLPRNSKSQATAWKNVSLADLPLDEKKRRILASACPFRTLLNLPGHTLLYLGTFEGEPVAFHTIWGLRTASRDESSTGRYVIGKSVITTLSPGLEIDSLSTTGGNLFERIDSFTLLGEE